MNSVQSRTNCQHNLRQLGLGIIQLSDTHKRLPPLFNYDDPKKPGAVAAFGGNYGSIFLHMVKSIDRQNRDADPLFDWKAGTAKAGAGQAKISIYLCPSDQTASSGMAKGPDGETWGLSSYAANFMVFGNANMETHDPDYPWASLNGANRYPESIPDGPSKTIMFTEKAGLCNGNGQFQGVGGSFWGYLPAFPLPQEQTYYNFGAVVGFYPYKGFHPLADPGNPWAPFYPRMYQDNPGARKCDPYAAQTPHTGGVINVAMCDGSVRSVALKSNFSYGGIISNKSWKSALTPSRRSLVDGDVDVLGRDWNDD
jgi:prepilin-type processing-associated H-X9-DG protein